MSSAAISHFGSIPGIDIYDQTGALSEFKHQFRLALQLFLRLIGEQHYHVAFLCCQMGIPSGFKPEGIIFFHQYSDIFYHHGNTKYRQYPRQFLNITTGI
jgi:hypothetical protein